MCAWGKRVSGSASVPGNGMGLQLWGLMYADASNVGDSATGSKPSYWRHPYCIYKYVYADLRPDQQERETGWDCWCCLCEF